MRRFSLAVTTAAAAGFVLAAAPSSSHAAEASCFGPGLFGNKMANGERLYPSTVAVAHKRIRLGTHLYVRVNARTIRVKVADRGPFVAGRHLDLTEAAVRRLGYPSCTAWGHRKVRSWRAR